MAQAVSTLSAYTNNKQRRPQSLRELGIYELPDGQQYVVSTLYADGCSLYPLHAWGNYGNAEFWASKDGRLLRGGIPTRWSVRDLKDTGKTSSYPRSIIL